jgi:hypothetical protein
MKLLATLATALSLLTSGSIFAQAGGESAPNAPQAALGQDPLTIRIMRNGSQPSLRVVPNFLLAQSVLNLSSPKIPRHTCLVPASRLSRALAQHGTSTRRVKY